jgi:type I restriction enzyme S subunit
MVREGYKETEIGEIPVEWEVGNVSDHCCVILSNVDKKTYPKEIPVFLCNYLDVFNNDYITQDIRFMIASATISEIQKYSISKNDVLITKDSETAEEIAITTAVIEDCGTVLCGYHLAIIRPKPDTFNGIFLSKSLNHAPIHRQFVRGAKGVTRYGLNKSEIKNAIIPLPPLPEQRRIAAVLSTIDEAIEKTEALIAKLRQVKAGLMQDLLTKGIDEEGRVRSEETHAFKDSELGRVPVEWEVVKIDHVKARQKNAISMGPFGSDITVDNFIESGIPVIRGQNLTHHYVSDEDFVYISPKKADELAACNAYKGDIVITHRGTIGQVSIIPQDSKYDRYVVSQSQMKLTCDANLVNPYFVNFYFNSELGKRRLLFRAGYTGVPAIGQPVT